MNAPHEIPDSIGGATRNLYRNASASPQVMRTSSFGGWNQLRETYRGTGFKGNIATAHGHKYEDAARQKAKDKLCLDLAGPTRLILGDYAASLDDITESGETILEIKCPFQGKNSKIWKSVNDYADPGMYYWQMVHQLMCAPNARTVVLFIYDSESGDYCHTEISRNLSDEADLKAEWDLFWAWKDTDDKDPKDGWIERFDEPWDLASREYLQAKKDFDAAREAMDAKKQVLIDLSDGEKIRGSGITVVHSTRIGTVNYKAIPELKGVDLDAYRGESSEIWTVK